MHFEFAGMFRDFFGSYKVAFIFLAVLNGSASVLCYVVNALAKSDATTTATRPATEAVAIV